MDWDPFEDVDRDVEDDPRVLRARAIEAARGLDPKVVACLGCGGVAEDWIARRGLTGEGVCRGCMGARDVERVNARAFEKTFRESLEALWALRRERDRKVAKELASVPF